MNEHTMPNDEFGPVTERELGQPDVIPAAPDLRHTKPTVRVLVDEPTRKAMSLAEAEAAALAWYRKEFGSGKDATDKDTYYARMGMLVHFIRDTFPPA